MPATPEEKSGSNTNLRVKLGDDRFLTRRFRTDNTLQAAIDWLGSLSSLVPAKLGTGEWKLVNTTTFPARDVDLAMDRKRTFYALGMWPSAEITLLPIRVGGSDNLRSGSGVVAPRRKA